MNKKETLLVIIVTFNSESQIDACIASVLNSKLVDISLKLAVVDNNSTDSTINVIKTKYASKVKNKIVSIISNSQNLGFAKAVNLCLKNHKYDYFLLLNPDLFVNSKSVDLAIQHCKESKSGIVGVSTASVNGVKTGSYFRLPNISVGIFDFTNLRKFSKTDFWHKYFYYKDTSIQPKFVDVVTGGFMLIKRDVVEKIGLLSESYFMYLEDVDFCRRAKSAGFKVSVCNETVTHIGGASSNNKDKVNHLAWIASRKIYYLKNHGFISNIIIQPIFLIDDIIIIIGRLLKK